jgi:hypothetical protein
MATMPNRRHPSTNHTPLRRGDLEAAFARSVPSDQPSALDEVVAHEAVIATAGRATVAVFGVDRCHSRDARAGAIGLLVGLRVGLSARGRFEGEVRRAVDAIGQASQAIYHYGARPWIEEWCDLPAVTMLGCYVSIQLRQPGPEPADDRTTSAIVDLFARGLVLGLLAGERLR